MKQYYILNSIYNIIHYVYILRIFNSNKRRVLNMSPCSERSGAERLLPLNHSFFLEG